MCQQTKCTATGFVIAPLSSRRILTNAHAVANQVAIKIRKHGSAQRYTARVLAVGHEVRYCWWCCYGCWRCAGAAWCQGMLEFACFRML
jgi:hypothetical protein